MGNTVGCPTWSPGCGQRPDRDSDGTQKVSLAALARQQVDRAAGGGGRHGADTARGHEKGLRQTVIGMSQGALAEHENPGEATVRVLHGRVRMIAGSLSWEAPTANLLIVPDARHSLEAMEVSARLLTVVRLA